MDARMKIVLIVLSWCYVSVALADSIITRSADIIECRVTQVGDDVVKYRKAEETFDREISRGDVFKIKYDNGEEECFPMSQQYNNTPAARQSVSIQPYGASQRYVNAETEPDWSAFPPASRQYHIGDWYSENGIEGIVVWTTPDGRHGRIVNKKKFNDSKMRAPAPFFRGQAGFALYMRDKSNGYANMKALNKFVEAHPEYEVDGVPIWAMLKKLGPGWYLPSIMEIEYFNRLRDTEVVYAGENQKFTGKRVKWHKVIDHVAKAHGGDKLNYVYLLSSTEVYSPGGASATFETLYGDPKDPQFALLKFDGVADDPVRPFVRTKGLPFIAFHLF